MDRSSRKALARRGPRRCSWGDCREPQWRSLAICVFHAEEAAIEYYAVMTAAYPRLKRLAEPPLPAQRVLNPKLDEGWVYYVLVDGHYKIGFTHDIAKRMRAYPPTASLLAQHRGSQADEAQVHRRFAAHRVAGREWFRTDAEITRHIDAVVAMHGRCVDPFVARRVKSEQEAQPAQLRRRSGIRR